jgi:hypothetical protein
MRRWFSGGLVIFIAGCTMGSRPIPVADARMAERSGVPLEVLQRGHGVFLTQCGQCHRLVPPDALKTTDWHLVIPGMCWNAGLTQADEALILKYVLAAKKRVRTHG